MRHILRSSALIVAGLTVLMLVARITPLAAQPAARWYKGNTHAHTINSDGDVPPDEVVRWYRSHGYQFTFITDHEYITDVAPLNALLGSASRFLVISAQEVTQRVSDPTHRDGVVQAHVNALGVTRVIRPLGPNNIAPPPISATYARNLAEIKRAGGVPQVNHPNFRWSVPLSEMIDLPDSTLFELWNGHPTVYNGGGTDSLGRTMPSTESLWDSLLTRGKVMFGVGDDDSHSFKPQDAENTELARPGRAWVMVRADTLTPEAILGALRRGDFYASTGVTLANYRASTTEVALDIAAGPDMRFRTDFIGSGGRVLASSTSLRPRYAVTGGEGYVRVRITDSAGRRAWTQPVMLR